MPTWFIAKQNKTHPAETVPGGQRSLTNIYTPYLTATGGHFCAYHLMSLLGRKGTHQGMQGNSNEESTDSVKFASRSIMTGSGLGGAFCDFDSPSHSL